MLRVAFCATAVGMAISLLWVLINMAIYGRFTIIEPNTAWLYCEIAILFGAFILSVYYLYKAVRK